MLSLNAAYWIAFGPHGPRSLPPPGENQKVIIYTLIGVGVSFVIFASMRMFAKPAPSTMTKEWQEASNEFLKVGVLVVLLAPSCRQSLTSPLPATGPEVRPLDRYLVRRLLRPGPGPVSLLQGIIPIRFSLSIDATSYTGDDLYNAGLKRKQRGGGALGFTGDDIGWCKYCTTLTMRDPLLLLLKDSALGFLYHQSTSSPHALLGYHS